MRCSPVLTVSRPAVLLVLASLALAVTSTAQAQGITRHEVGLGASLSSTTPNADNATLEALGTIHRDGVLSPQLRYTFNLNRNVALESTFAPSVYHVADNLREGGRETLILGGLRAGIRHGRLGLFGTSAAGASSFQCGEHEIYPVDQCTRETHFALQQGIAAELSLSPRTALRIDAAELLTAQFRRVYQFDPASGFPLSTSFSAVPHHFSLAVSATRRFGRLQTLPAPPDAHPAHTFSLGGLFLMNMQQHLLEYEVRATGGGGAWLGFPLLPGRAGRFLSADLVAYDQPHDDHTANSQDGGTIFSAFLGPKLGFRKGPVGLYAKARPGITRFSRTDVVDIATRQGLRFVSHPKVDFALDTGLVVDYVPPFPTHRLRPLLRFEGGSTYIHYHGANSYFVNELPGLRPTGNVQTFYSPPQRHTTLTFLTGLGVRF